MSDQSLLESLLKDASMTKKLRYAASRRLISNHWACVISLNITASSAIVFSIFPQFSIFPTLYPEIANLIPTFYSIFTLVLSLIIFAYDYSRRSWELHKNAVNIDFFHRHLQEQLNNLKNQSQVSKNISDFNSKYESIINETINHDEIDYFLFNKQNQNLAAQAYYFVKSKTIKLLMFSLAISPLIVFCIFYVPYSPCKSAKVCIQNKNIEKSINTTSKKTNNIN